MGYFWFFKTQTGLFTALYPTICIKKYKNPLNFYLLQVKKFYGDSVKNKSASAKKLEGWLHRPPPCLGLTDKLKCKKIRKLYLHLSIPQFSGSHCIFKYIKGLRGKISLHTYAIFNIKFNIFTSFLHFLGTLRDCRCNLKRGMPLFRTLKPR